MQQSLTRGTMLSIVPYKLFATFIASIYVFPRRGGGTLPYRAFIGWQRIVKHFVGTGLDRSGVLWWMPFKMRDNFLCSSNFLTPAYPRPKFLISHS